MNTHQEQPQSGLEGDNSEQADQWSPDAQELAVEPMYGAAGQYAYIGIKKLKEDKRPNIILVAAKHNKREERRGKAAYNTNLSHLNQCLHGPATAKEVDALADRLMLDAGVSPRANSIFGIEFVFSIPINCNINIAEYFASCTDWVGNRFSGRLNILSSDIHLDEANPHCHVLLLPLYDSGLNGGRMLGVGKEFDQHVDNFYSDVAATYGFMQPARLLRGDEKELAIKRVIEAYENNPHLIALGGIPAGLLKAINRKPDDFLAELGIARPSKTAGNDPPEQSEIGSIQSDLEADESGSTEAAKRGFVYPVNVKHTISQSQPVHQAL